MDTEKSKQQSDIIAGESLTKLALNNKIVEMRKNVRQSRVQCINKLIRELRKLKTKKGTEEQISKNLKKIDRLTKQMAVMKKVNADVISKFALQNEKSLDEITNDVNETVENKALARLACHKSVHQKVLEFREQFSDWKKSLMLLLESLGEKYKDKKRTPVASKKKEKKLDLTRKNKNLITKEDSKVPSTQANISSSSGLWIVATCKSENANREDEESDDKNGVLDQSTGPAETLNSYEFPEVADKKVKIESSTEITSKENIMDTSSNSAALKVSNVSNSKPKLKKLQVFNRNAENESSIESVPEKVIKMESPSTPVNSNSSNEKPKNKSNLNMPIAVADPFFMTKDNEEYLSISTKHMNDTEESPVDYKEHRGTKPKSKSERFRTKPDQFKPNQNNSFGKRKNFDSSRGKPGNPKDVPAPSVLHPSWAAKKKQSSVILNSQFQGKKIKFDD